MSAENATNNALVMRSKVNELGRPVMSEAEKNNTSASLLSRNMLCNICATQFQKNGPRRTCTRCSSLGLASAVPFKMLERAFDFGGTGGLKKVWDLMNGLRGKCPDNCRIAMSRLCALYVPHLVKLFLQLQATLLELDEDPVAFRGHVVIELLEYNHCDPYFNKFLWTERFLEFPESVILAREVGRYILVLKKSLDETVNNFIKATVQRSHCQRRYKELERRIIQTIRILAFLLEVQVDRTVVWRELEPYVPALLETIFDYYQSTPEWGENHATFRRLEYMLKWDERSIKFARDRNHIARIECSYPGCKVKRSKMYQCARCQTVIYCGQVHQKEHWTHGVEAHRAACYATAF